jgi:hypothetical protein
MLQAVNNWNKNQTFHLTIPSRDSDLVQLTKQTTKKAKPKLNLAEMSSSQLTEREWYAKAKSVRDRRISGKKKWQELWLCMLLMATIKNRCSLSQHTNNLCMAVDRFSSYLSVTVCSSSSGSVKADCSWNNNFSETWEISCTAWFC